MNGTTGEGRSGASIDLSAYSRQVVSEETVRVALDAAFPGLPAGMTLDEAERRIRAALAAVGTRIRAQALRDAVTVIENRMGAQRWSLAYLNGLDDARDTVAGLRSTLAPDPSVLDQADAPACRSNGN